MIGHLGVVLDLRCTVNKKKNSCYHMPTHRTHVRLHAHLRTACTLRAYTDAYAHSCRHIHAPAPLCYVCAAQLFLFVCLVLPCAQVWHVLWLQEIRGEFRYLGSTNSHLLYPRRVQPRFVRVLDKFLSYPKPDRAPFPCCGRSI